MPLRMIITDHCGCGFESRLEPLWNIESPELKGALPAPRRGGGGGGTTRKTKQWQLDYCTVARESQRQREADRSEE